MEVLKQLLGRLHPIVVHLPIGFILAGLLFQWLNRRKKDLNSVVAQLYLWGTLAAVLACLTGYLQYLGEGYAFETVKVHLWFGILTALVSLIMHLRLKEKTKFKFWTKTSKSLIGVILLIIISYTGHLGGSITHGDDYLVEPLPNSWKSALGFEVYKEIPININEENWEQAQLYNEVVAPILNNNCVSCHNKKKAKGALLLNTAEGILKGGENGEVLNFTNPEESDLYIRLLLPENHDDHMPPKGKKQPNKEEIAVLKSWIAAGAPFDKSIGELDLQQTLFNSFFPDNTPPDYPEVEIIAASIDSINMIKSEGIHVQQISTSTNFLLISCINKPNFTDKDFVQLSPIKNQIAVLDLGGTQITDNIFEQIAELPYLTVLKLDNTAITGSQLAQLHTLEYLRVLNMTSTEFQKSYLEQLYGFKTLESVFLAYTGLNLADNRENASKTALEIEFGNYELPIIESDSIIY